MFVENHVKPLIGATRLSRLASARVVEFRDVDLLQGGRTRETSRRALKTLSSICRFAAQRGWISGNPCDGITIVVSSRHKEQVRPPEHADIEKLRSTAKDWIKNPPRVEMKTRDPITPYEDIPGRWRVRYTKSKGERVSKTFRSLEAAERFSREINESAKQYRPLLTERAAKLLYSIVEAAIETGCRLSEIRGMPKSAVDCKELTIEVFQRADEKGNLGKPKSLAGRRKIDIPRSLLAVLDGAAAASPSDLLFPAENGRPLSASNFYSRYWIPLLEACDLAERWRADETDEEGLKTAWGFHYLRHYHASRAIGRGVDLKHLSEEMGHSSVKVTLDIYGHLMKDEESKKRRRLKAVGDENDS